MTAFPLDHLPLKSSYDFISDHLRRPTTLKYSTRYSSRGYISIPALATPAPYRHLPAKACKSTGYKACEVQHATLFAQAQRGSSGALILGISRSLAPCGTISPKSLGKKHYKACLQ